MVFKSNIFILMSLNKEIKDFRNKRKQDLISVFGYRCGICGYYRCEAALEFHHVNPKEKSYSLSNSKFRTLKEDLEEASKCILVCSNCHREIHYTDRYKNVDLFKYQNFNKIIVEKLLKKEKK